MLWALVMLCVNVTVPFLANDNLRYSSTPLTVQNKTDFFMSSQKPQVIQRKMMLDKNQKKPRKLMV